MLRRTLICFLFALLLAGPASAGDIVVKLGLAPGKLQATATHTSATRLVITVADGRGNGAGWSLRASRPVQVTGISARCAANSTCTLPQAAATPSGQLVLKAAKGTGMGVFTLTVTLASPPAGVSFAVS